LFKIGFIRHKEGQDFDMTNSDDLKGRAKEAVGDLTNNDDLKRDGQTDRKAGKAKDFIDTVGEKAKEVVDEVKEKIHPSQK
jgi:uncharacterized protein YjbJ (UPF0337 family)